MGRLWEGDYTIAPMLVFETPRRICRRFLTTRVRKGSCVGVDPRVDPGCTE